MLRTHQVQLELAQQLLITLTIQGQELFAQRIGGLQKEIITITAETIGYPRAYAIGYGKLIEFVPFPFGHGFYSFLTIKLVAEN